MCEKIIFLKRFNLDIFGEIDNDNYFSKVNEFIHRNKNIQYLGPLNKKIQQKLSKYDVFIHPSKSENFGLVIYEALSSGLFLILNKDLKKKELNANSFAKNINFNQKSLDKIIKQILKKKNYIKSLEYKKKCLKFIKVNYDWNVIANDYLKKYLNLVDNI